MVNMKRKITFTAIFLCAAMMLSAAFGGCADKDSLTVGTQARRASDYRDIYDSIKAERKDTAVDELYDLIVGSIVYDEMVLEDSEVSYNAAMSADDYSQTNTQSRGVDEGDIIKTDGKYIYRIVDNRLVIIDPHTMTLLSDTRIGKSVSNCEMYVSGDVLVTVYYYNGYWDEEDSDYYGKCDRQETITLIYDISDRSEPKVVSRLSQDGSYCTSRMIGDTVYTVSLSYIYSNEAEKNTPESFVPSVSCEDESRIIKAEDIMIIDGAPKRYFSVITSVDVTSPDDFRDVSSVLGGTSDVYVSSQGNLYLAAYKSDYVTRVTYENGPYLERETKNSTLITRFELRDGEIDMTASASVPGTLLNQFSMDEHNGYFRLVTTLGNSVHSASIFSTDMNWEDTRSTGLYILDESLETVGSVEGLAEGERVYSVRFDGDIGYFVTFRQVDPLFAVDLSDPTSPEVLSKLKIPGFSTYLHPYDDGLLFGLGFDADEETGWIEYMKISMFDVSDPADVSEKHKLVLEGVYDSEAAYNHKAITVSAKKNIIAFAGSGDRYLVYGYDAESGFEKRAEIELDVLDYSARGLFIGDEFFVCSSDGLTKYSLSDFSKIDNVCF
ncbi:MAG: hypothetical protein E7546_05675 [Ruminococcaceae bacterium]|nr:hypothetical protein [Oscillospiraceae bacterium]